MTQTNDPAPDHVFLVTAGAISTGTVATIWAWSFAYDYLPDLTN